MRFHWFITDRTRLGLKRPALTFALIFLAFLVHSILLSAQQSSPPNAPPPPDSSAYVLHAYANLVQIPTIIVSPALTPLPPVRRDDIDISLDSGPLFHPTYTRFEGNEPLDLAIFVDLSGPAYAMQTAFNRSMREFAARSLRPGDRISIYVKDCFFIRSMNNVSTTDGALLESALNDAANFPGMHGEGKRQQGCGRSMHLWNALATVASSMNDPHRRRIILAVSAGADHGSRFKWDQLIRFAGSGSISIFGLHPESAPDKLTPVLAADDPFNALCQLTGGLVFNLSPLGIGEDLSHVIDLVRNRYILEFPRPNKGKRGQHSIVVTLANGNAFIRPAGISYPLPDPASLSGTNTVPSPPSPAVYGKRSTVSPPQ
jgi:hypothetical protein